ncbi:MAG: hypothetical protein WC919_03905 [Candidatus Paceibacterota bacterium]|jgi:hypothetical protein
MASTSHQRLENIGFINNGNRCWINALTHILMNIKCVREAASHLDMKQYARDVDVARYFVSAMETVVNPQVSKELSYPTVPKPTNSIARNIDEVAQTFKLALSGMSAREKGNESGPFTSIWQQTFAKGDTQTYANLANSIMRVAVYDYYHNDDSSSAYTQWAATELLYAVSIMKDEGPIWVLPISGDPNDLTFIICAIDLLHEVCRNVENSIFVSKYRASVCTNHLEQCMREIIPAHYNRAHSIDKHNARPIITIAPFSDQPSSDVFQTCAMIELEDTHDTQVKCSIKGCGNRATHYCTSRAFGETAIFAIPSVSLGETAKRYPPIVPRAVLLPSRDDQDAVVMSQYVLVGQVHYNGGHYTMSRYCSNGKLMLFDDNHVSDVSRDLSILDNTPITMLMYEIDARPIISSNALRILRSANAIQAQRTSHVPVSKQISYADHDDRAMAQQKQQEADDRAMAQQLQQQEERAQPSMYGTPAATAVPYVQPSASPRAQPSMYGTTYATTVSSYVPPSAPPRSVFSLMLSNPKYDV